MDLAAGAYRCRIKGFPSEPPADQAPLLLAVKLPRASVRDTSGAFLEFYLLQGVRHILSRARMIHADAKVVIVSSYGFHGGPHDGASQIERVLDAEIAAAQNDVEIVLPSGNGRLARSHARRRFDRIPEQVLDWRLPPDDRTPSVMEIWLRPDPGGPDPVLELSLVTPGGLDSRDSGATLPDTNTTDQLVLTDGGQTVLQAVCVHPAMHPGYRQFLIWLQPTAASGPDIVARPAPSGVWTVRLRALDPTRVGAVDAWIRRDDSLVGFPSGGRQSVIERDWTEVWKDDPTFDQSRREAVGNDGTAQRSRTISKIATGGRTVITGGFDVDRANSFPVPSSAGGPVAPRPDPTWPPRAGPDTLAPAQLFGGIGLAAAGFYGGGKVRYRGTSVAAPLVTAELAAAIQGTHYPGGRSYVAMHAALSEITLPAVARPSADLGGAGRYVTTQMHARGMAFEFED